MSARKTTTELIIGGIPRVDLLPPEVRARERDRTAGGWAILAIVAAVGVVASGYAFSSVLGLAAQAHLGTVSSRTAELLVEQNKYIEVQQIRGQIELTGAAQRVGAASMTDWSRVVGEVSAALPGSVLSFRGDVATPLEGFPQTTVPLQGARIGALQVIVRTVTLPDLSNWVEALADLDFVVDSVAGTVSIQEDGSYLTDVVIHIDEDAIANRFLLENMSAEGATDQEVTEP